MLGIIKFLFKLNLHTLKYELEVVYSNILQWNVQNFVIVHNNTIPLWLLFGCIWNVERFYSLTRRTLFLAENTREHLSRHPGGRSGNRGVKSNGFNFSLDSSTSLLLYTQLVIYVAEPLVHLPPFRGLAFLGGFERKRGVGPNSTFEFDERVTGIETYDWGTHSRNEQRRKGIFWSRSEERWPGLPTSRREASREARKRRGKTFR